MFRKQPIYRLVCTFDNSSSTHVMALLETNPTQLQLASGDAIPLFLIHDGGGTIIQYFMLGNLNRNAYGIHDPKFECENNWEGGMVEMAQEYIKLIRAIRGAGPIFLGG